MKEREYHIKIHSRSRFIIAMIVVLCSLSVLIVEYLPRTQYKIISILQFIAILLISFYIANQIGMAKVKVIFTNEGFIHVWIRRFFFSWERNIKISWDLVDNYVFQEDRTFDSFIINLTNNTRYKINRLNVLPVKDDFKKLVIDFPKLSNEYINELNSDNQTKTIKQGESIYASKSFKWVFYFMSAGFLVIVLTKVFNPNSETAWSSLGVIGSGLIFYGLMIKGQKKNN
ncbi:hypothetical protein [Gaoshiqia sp. Z1-71]|uniref:hypothetical protein n=1 Tax=Gaoshiqia hydrogeniformans TaxID=3290090 RepID=UPI003BF8F608